MTERTPIEIAVTGMGAICALGTVPDAIFARLLTGERGFDRIRAFDTTGCRVDIAAEAPDPEVPAELRAAVGSGLTRTAALAVHAARSAVVEAGLTRQIRRRAALVLGSAGLGTPALEAYLGAGAEAQSGLLRGFPKRTLTDVTGLALDLQGPRATLNTACSSGAVALLHAADWLRAGRCDVALAGGADELTRFTLTGFCSLRAVDPEPCRPFDRRRRGMTLGEGAAVLVLERRADAERRGARILATLAGAGHSCDAGHLTAPDPGGEGASRAIAAALEEAGVGAGDVGFVNAHGTGTPHNDRAEVAAIVRAFGACAPSLPVHTVKASIGHCMGAAGALEAVLTVLSLRAGLVPPTAGLADPELPDAVRLVRGAPQPVAARFGLSNSFGFGGNNAALLFGWPGGGA